jgi:maltose O-acetyltransferase
VIKRVIILKKKLKEFIFWKIRGQIPIWAYQNRGLKIGESFSMEPGCNLDYSHCWLIKIGNDVTLAPNVHILAHDASTKRALGYTKIGKVTIGDRVFIGAGVTILPNITIGSDVVVAAGTVVIKNIPANSIVAGNPMRIIGSTSEYLNKNRRIMDTHPKFNSKFTVAENVSEEKKLEMIQKMGDDIGYVK